MTHRVLVVDDHPLFRKGVVQLLALEPSISVVGEGAHRADAVRLAREADPDLVLLDLNLKGPAGAESGIDVLAELKADDPSRRVVLLTVSDAADDLVRAIRTGADGYLLKDMEPEDLLARIREALDGRWVIDPSLAHRLADAMRAEAQAGSVASTRNLQALTEREVAVLRCLADGQSNKLIARTLSITEGTVKVHVKHLLRKLDFRSRVEAAVWASESGLRKPGG